MASGFHDHGRQIVAVLAHDLRQSIQAVVSEGQGGACQLGRNAARRQESAAFTLTVGITGKAAGATAGDARPWDAKVHGTPYHATGTVPCSVGPDPKGASQCSVGVIRGANGHAEVHLAPAGFDVTLHKDRIRVLTFTSSSVTSTNPKEKVTFEKRGDEWLVAVDNFYFYTIPEAVIVGG